MEILDVIPPEFEEGVVGVEVGRGLVGVAGEDELPNTNGVVEGDDEAKLK